MTAVMKYTDMGATDLRGVRWWCPGCDAHHVVPIDGPAAWGFNGDIERPTLTPSVLVNGVRGTSTEEWNRRNPRCHTFVRDGRIEFLSDCEHELAGQTVPMRPLRSDEE